MILSIQPRGQVTEMRPHGHFETLESKIHCSVVDARLRNVSNVSTQLILNGRQMHVCMIGKPICDVVSVLMVITTHCVAVITVVNQGSRSGCFWVVCGLC